MKIAFLGNFGPSFSTESHVAADLESLGHKVVRIQEGAHPALDVPRLADGCEMFIWTQTYDYACAMGSIAERTRMLEALDMPTVGFHLDRWWGLDRADQLEAEPFFRVDHLFTADGDPRNDWARYGINHHWSPPGVYSAEAIDGAPQRAYTSDLAFVGSWRAYAHTEWWGYRRELLGRLQRRYRARVRFWPRNRAIRGAELNDLYASVKIVVGDSCLAGGIRRYWSDRTPETTGRGGFLIHPSVEGFDEWHPDVPTWDVGDWDALEALIDRYLRDDEARETKRAAMVADTRAHHTYRNRLERVLGVVMNGDRDDSDAHQPVLDVASS